MEKMVGEIDSLSQRGDTIWGQFFKISVWNSQFIKKLTRCESSSQLEAGQNWFCEIFNNTGILRW